jgi:TRAP-type mannitol/chloroaromatic compound transport system substrate-binding protein
MKRRGFVTGAGLGLAATAVAAPAIAQTTSAMPEVKWRLTSSFPKSLDTLYGAAEFFSKRVAEMTDNKFQIRSFAAGEIVPAFQALDAVQNGTVELCHTAPYYFIGKDPTFAFDSSVPFGPNARQQQAWMVQGGGLELMREFYKDYNCTTYPCGNTGAQMGGWLRKEVKSVEDMKGLKFRVGGFAGMVMSKLGVVPQQIPGGEIYPALEKGTIDAAEWVGPYDDEKLGFHKVAPYYYYPGWWEGSTQVALLVSTKALEALPATYRAIVQAAAAETNTWVLTKYDAQNPAALRRLIAAGAQLRAWPRPVMEACFQASNEVCDETAAKNPKFKKIYESWKTFRDEQYLWFRVAENAYDTFMMAQSARRT